MNTSSGLGSRHPGVSRLTNMSVASRPSRLVNMRVHDTDLKTAPSQVTSNTKDLELSIAADYTAARIDAAKASLPSDSPENQNELSLAIRKYRGASSIDEVANTAAEAIASIRNATDPDDVSKQLTALKKFSDGLKKDTSIPEMQDLSDTLDKFIAVVIKSTGIKLIEEKPTTVQVKTKAVSKPTVKKVVTKPVVSASASKVVVGRTIPRPEPKSFTTTKPVKKPSRSSVKSSTKVATTRRVTTRDDAALRHALRSVATMDEKPAKVSSKKPQKSTRSTDKTAARRAARMKREAKAYAKTRKTGTGKRFILAFGCAAACVAAIIYCVSTNIPDISVRVAAMQTGVEASYPSYIPRDFSLEGINSENGKITLSFIGPEGAKFTLIEEKSSWDSTALLRNYVEPTWHESYTTTHEQGITIYINGSNAAWVNGGVLYKINSTSNTLTKKQLRNIVTSM